MLWRYVTMGVGLLMLMAAVYPDAGEETALVLYTAGLISLFWGLLNSPPQPIEPDTFSHSMKKDPIEPPARNTSALPYFIIAIAVIGILLVGTFIAGIFFLIAAEEYDSGPWDDEAIQYADDTPQEILFTDYDNDRTSLVDLSGDRIDLSDTHYILFSDDGFQERIGRVWINITPLSGFHLTGMAYENNAIQADGVLFEGEVLQYQYQAGLTDWTTYEPDPVTGKVMPVTSYADDSTVEVVATGGGGAAVRVNNSTVAIFRPPYVTDAWGESQVMSSSFDQVRRVVTFYAETDDLAYPLSWTLYF